ncbi:MAG: permease [Bacteroidota bacterium]
MMWTNPAVQKTLSLLLLIGLGALLRGKLKHKDALGGVKVLILSVALPATIFVALLKIEVEPHLLMLPILALGANLILLGVFHQMLPWLGMDPRSATGKTMLMLLPSLAPGLSCFPFLMEFLGDESLALAALADVGNKVFVLIILYLLAMRWYYQRVQGKASRNGKVKALLLSLVREPVNLLITLALVMLAVGWNFSVLPSFLQNTVVRASAMMTPMILLFIGMAVKIRWTQVQMIFSFLAFRSALAFLMSGIFLIAFPELAPAIALVVVVFPQSACSFWPYAHMAAVDGLEEKRPASERTFDTDTGLAVLACSLPFSTMLIMSICSIGEAFTQPWLLLLVAGCLGLVAFLPRLSKKISFHQQAELPLKDPERLHS